MPESSSRERSEGLRKSSKKTNLPSVSVIVPVYNAEDTIKECVDSILSLNYPTDKLELIFVNNSSTDNTPIFLKEYDGRIKIFHERKKGPAATRNKGILNSYGEIIAFTDADCSVDKNWLKKIVKPLQDISVPKVGQALPQQFGPTVPLWQV